MTQDVHTVVFTVCSANYLGRAKLLFDSLRVHAPFAQFALLVCEKDEIVDQVDLGKDVTIYRPSDILPKHWKEFAFKYNVVECNTAVKPFVIEHLFEQNADHILYLDPDIEAHASLSPLFKLLTQHEMVLTPHITKPLYDDGGFPSVEHYLNVGQFNLGFLALRKSEETKGVIRWWASMLGEKCLHQFGSGYFVDQYWAALFASLCPNIFILRHAGYNMAWWNAFQRELNDQLQTEDGPLVLFHYSHLPKDNLAQVAPKQTRSKTTEGSPLYNLLLDYQKRLVETHKTLPLVNKEYSFGLYDDGSPIEQQERALYHAMTAQEKVALGDPFSAKHTLQQKVIGHNQRKRKKRLLSLPQRALRALFPLQGDSQ